MNRSTKPLKFDPYRLLIENLEDYAILVLDLHGLIVTWNAGAQILTGYAAEEIIGQHVTKLYPLEDIENDTPQHVLTGAARNGRAEQEGWQVRKDGSRYWAVSVVRALRDESGKLLGFGEIIRESKERDLLRSIADLEKTHRMKDDFLATVSHELLTPLTSASGWVKLLRDRRLSPLQVEHGIDVIDRNLAAQRDLIEDLLNVSRILCGKLTISPQPVNLGPIIHQTLDSLRPSIDAKQLRLDLDLDSNIGMVRVDPIRFQQIVWNLVTNAVKFTARAGSIRVRLKHTDHQAVFSVTDTGVGISREFLPYVFDRFRQAESPHPRRHGGLGLGLSIVRHLVELHGGTVSVNSRGTGQGSTFSVCIPVGTESLKPRGNRRTCEMAAFTGFGSIQN